MSAIKLASEILRIVMEEQKSNIIQTIEVRDNQNWISLLRSFSGLNTLIFFSRKKIFSKRLMLQSQIPEELVYVLDDSEFYIQLKINLKSKDLMHFSYKIKSKKEIYISKVIARYQILLGNKPDFTWVPHVMPQRNYVVGDHVFRSPVIIYGKHNLYFALFPDLKILERNRLMQSFLEFDLGETPFVSFGLGNYKPSRHILFKHNPKILIDIKKNQELEFGYYIKVYNTNSVLDVIKNVNSFLWDNNARELIYRDFNPQVVPFRINIEEGYNSIFERFKAWGDFEINGIPCGGFWQKSYIGKEKTNFRYLSQDKLLETIPVEIKDISPYSGADAVIWNNAWFLNIRSSYSFKYFGKIWSDSELLEKSNKILNTILSLPRTEGLFPSLIYPSAPNTKDVATINGVKAFIKTNDFNLVDASLAMYWALRIYQDFNGKDAQILLRSKTLISFIEKIQLSDGSIPVFINFTNSISPPIIRKELLKSASSGAMLMFILEYYKITKIPKILSIAESITQYLLQEILPYNKWHDFEIFFSCTNQPFNTYDKRTKSHYMNTLCIYWCAEGLKELFKITNNKTYLDAGEYVLSTLSLFQQVWNMPYISFNTFGGFCSQNSDAELNDARTALFVRTYMEYYLETGEKEYMERGIAALRASWALQLLSEYQEQCPGNLQGITELDGIDRGGMFENYGHYGEDVRVDKIIEFDWGIGSAATAVAYTKFHFGDLFIDFKEKLVWGIDGILIKSFEFTNDRVSFEYDIITGKKELIIKTREEPQQPVEIYANGKLLGTNKIFKKVNGYKIKLD